MQCAACEQIGRYSERTSYLPVVVARHLPTYWYDNSSDNGVNNSDHGVNNCDDGVNNSEGGDGGVNNNNNGDGVENSGGGVDICQKLSTF